MMKFKHRICFILTTALALMLASAAASASTIDNVRVWPSPERTRIVFDVAAEPHYTYFTLYQNGPKRIVIDFQNTKNNVDLSAVDTDSLLLDRVRTSTPADNSSARIVLDVTAAVDPTIFKLAPSGPYGHRLVVDLPGTSIVPEREQRVVRTAERGENRRVIIAIDAGHGGQDPGSIGPSGTYEKLVTLAVAQRLAAKINADPAMEAVLTRTGDYGLSLAQRALLIRKARADFFISIHADAFTTPQPRGASVWVLSRRRSETEYGRALENKERLSEELYELGPTLQANSDDPFLARALLDMRRDDSMQDGSLAAGLLLEQLGRITTLHRPKPQGASFAVLSNIGTPSVLVELGFISNPQKERLLRSAAHQEKLATALYAGLRSHFIRHPVDGTILAHQQLQRHIVARGESLSILAQRYNTTVDAIVQFNDLGSTSIRIGQELQIPTS
ncbi:MAG TPA: N-acetylmuramoyl-L-alanine amidase [Aliidiomarina sp.]|nr:N-acetylmuramoyl-L-alanine amidase [Aliidiomarina sp.]